MPFTIYKLFMRCVDCWVWGVFNWCE